MENVSQKSFIFVLGNADQLTINCRCDSFGNMNPNFELATKSKLVVVRLLGIYNL